MQQILEFDLLSTKDYDILITAYFWAFLNIHNIIFF